MKRQPITDPTLEGQLAATLGERGALAGIPAELLENLVRHGTLLELGAGESLVREGEAATPEVYLLVEGALTVQSKAGFIARLHQPGDVIGEVAAVLSARRTADVIAETAVRVVAVPTGLLATPEFADVAAGVRSAMLRDDWVQY